MKKGLEDKVDKVSLSLRVQSFEEVNRELTKVNDTLNALLEKTTQTSEVDTTEGTEGNPGDIKTILNSDKTYSFSIRTEDGWKTPFLENREIIFKSKNPSAGKIKKSIDEIESNSIDEAKKTIFDEKADKFIIARADYNSGWIDVADYETTGTHSLESTPLFGIYQFSNDGGTTIQSGSMGSQSGEHAQLEFNTTAWTVKSAVYYGYWARGSSSSISFDRINYTGWTGGNANEDTLNASIKIRVLLWK